MKRRYILIGIAAFIVLAGIITLLGSFGGNKGKLELSAPAKTPGNAKVSVQIQLPDPEEPVRSLSLDPGETKTVSLPTGKARVNGSAGNIKSIDVVTIAANATTKLQTPTGEQRAIQRLATNAQFCPAIVADKTYSYNCDGEGGILKHENILRAEDPFMFDATSFNFLKPYREGLLGYSIPGNELQYVDIRNNSVTTVSLPEPVQSLMQKEQPHRAIQQKQGSSRFVLSFTEANKLYLFQDITDKNPVELKLEKGVRLNDSERDFSITFDIDHIIILAGISEHAEEGNTEGAEHSEELPDLPIYVFEYDTSGKATNTIELPRQTIINSLHKLANNFYAADQLTGFDFYHYSQGKLEKVYSIPEVGNWVISGGDVYLQAEGTLFQFVAKQNGEFGMRSLFTAPQITVSKLYDTSIGLVFTALAGTTADAPLNIYKLLSTPQTSDKPATQYRPTYTGFNAMTAYGMTAEQQSNLEYALEEYLRTTSTQFARITARDLQPLPHDRNTPYDDAIEFEVTVNSTVLKARVEYAALVAVRLYLYDKNNNLIFDSKNI